MCMTSSVEVGPGNEIGRTDQVEEGAVIQPAATLDELDPQQGDVRGRPAEGGEQAE